MKKWREGGESGVYFVEPRIVENVEAALMDDGRAVAFYRGERSGHQVGGIATGHVPLEPFEERRRQPHVLRQDRHSFFPCEMEDLSAFAFGRLLARSLALSVSRSSECGLRVR